MNDDNLQGMRRQTPDRSSPPSPKNPLSHYHSKRDFKKTSEPYGKVHKKSEQTFVIQRHQASSLHYDFRLELGGVLKSWAVPKEPMMDPKVRRLAMQVEDHPVEYATFHGDIPSGEYGAGHVDIWDSGTWRPLDSDAERAYKNGKLSFVLRGGRLNGRWSLIRTKMANGRSKNQSWLLIKADDEWATPSGEVIEAPQRTRKRTKAKAAQRATAGRDVPSPQLAVLVDVPPAGEDWVFEQKYDGYRILAQLTRDEARLYSRHHNDWTRRFEVVANALTDLHCESALIDGEVVALNEKGLSDFQVLQKFLSGEGSSSELIYFAFDLLELDGDDLRGLPLMERKKRLAKLLARKGGTGPLRLSECLQGEGRLLFNSACRNGWEGLICKRSRSAYREGRTEDWLKVKCSLRQEFVIAGYTEPKGSREHLGAPFEGLRTDKPADDVRIEKAKTIDRKRRPANPGAQLAEKVAQKSTRNSVRKSEINSLSKPSLNSGPKLTHPERVLFPETGTTKRDLADYYGIVGERMLKSIHHRPLALKRCPEGRRGECFFQQHFKADFGLGTSLVQIEERGRLQSKLQLDEIGGLQGLVQYGVLEIHVWSARSSEIEAPDQLIFDLDPDPKTEWSEVVMGTFELKKRLENLGLPTFVKLSGGKGVHVHVPLKAGVSWQEAHAFSEGLARELEESSPETFTAVSAKKNRAGRIYIDYLRNSRGVTSIAPYSTRAREGAPVALPIFWEELTPKIKPNEFTVGNVAERLIRVKADPWAHFESSAVHLSENASAEKTIATSKIARKTGKRVGRKTQAKPLRRRSRK